MKDIKEIVSKEIYQNTKYILENQLQGITKYQSFDLDKINYTIDNLDFRIQKIVESIIDLTIEALLPKMEKIIENNIRKDIVNKMIRKN